MTNFVQSLKTKHLWTESNRVLGIDIISLLNQIVWKTPTERDLIGSI
jgi:hypothetical protein